MSLGGYGFLLRKMDFKIDVQLLEILKIHFLSEEAEIHNRQCLLIHFTPEQGKDAH